jgi:hypothetical protein
MSAYAELRSGMGIALAAGMRASIIVFTALGLLWTTSPALAQETPSPVASANAQPDTKPDTAQRSHRVYAGSALGGGSYGARPTAVLGLDVSYAYRTASGRDLGATAMLATGNMFAAAFADVFAVPITSRLSWRIGAEAGLHRISPRYSSLALFPRDYEIVSAPHGVFLPHAGARMSIDTTRSSGFTWGIEVQVLHDLILARHEVHSRSQWGGSNEEMQNVGGSTVMLGLYMGRAR